MTLKKTHLFFGFPVYWDGMTMRHFIPHDFTGSPGAENAAAIGSTGHGSSARTLAGKWSASGFFSSEYQLWDIMIFGFVRTLGNIYWHLTFHGYIWVCFPIGNIYISQDILPAYYDIWVCLKIVYTPQLPTRGSWWAIMGHGLYNLFIMMCDVTWECCRTPQIMPLCLLKEWCYTIICGKLEFLRIGVA